MLCKIHTLIKYSTTLQVHVFWLDILAVAMNHHHVKDLPLTVIVMRIVTFSKTAVMMYLMAAEIKVNLSSTCMVEVMKGIDSYMYIITL